MGDLCFSVEGFYVQREAHNQIPGGCVLFGWVAWHMILRMWLVSFCAVCRSHKHGTVTVCREMADAWSVGEVC